MSGSDSCDGSSCHSEHKRIIRVISDLHLNSKWFVDRDSNGQASPQKEKLEEFFSHLSEQASRIKTLILLGDIFESWSIGLDEQPDAMRFLHCGPCKWFRDRIHETLQQGVDVVYVRGNHDNLISFEELDTFFNAKLSHDDRKVKIWKKVDENYEQDSILFSHGHENDIYNHELPENELQNLHPMARHSFGYYACRLDCEYDFGKPQGSLFRVFRSIIRRTPRQLGNRILRNPKLLKVFLEQSWNQLHTLIPPPEKQNWELLKVTLPDGSSPTLAEIRKEWVSQHAKILAKRELFAELQVAINGNYKHFLKEHGKGSIVVHGHTHSPTVELRNGLIYCNCGSWGVDIDHPVFIDITLDEGKIHVTQFEMQDDLRQVKEKHVHRKQEKTEFRVTPTSTETVETANYDITSDTSSKCSDSPTESQELSEQFDRIRVENTVFVKKTRKMDTKKGD